MYSFLTWKECRIILFEGKTFSHTYILVFLILFINKNRNQKFVLEHYFPYTVILQMRLQISHVIMFLSFTSAPKYKHFVSPSVLCIILILMYVNSVTSNVEFYPKTILVCLIICLFLYSINLAVLTSLLNKKWKDAKHIFVTCIQRNSSIVRK